MEHWSTPDPSFVPGGPEVVHQAFRQVRDRLEVRIAAFLEELRSGARGKDGRPAGAATRREAGITKRAARR
jgi:hypothetical protein